MQFNLTQGADGSYLFAPVGSSWTPPAPSPTPPPPPGGGLTPTPPAPSPAPTGVPGANVFIELCTAQHEDGVATFPIVFSNTTGEGYSRFRSKLGVSDLRGSENVKTCFSVPFTVATAARSGGVASLSSFEVAPRQYSASYDVSISKVSGVFGAGAEFTALDQGTSPSISFAVNATDQAGALIIPAGDYFFNASWASQLDGFLAKPNGFDNNISVIVRGAGA